MITMTTQVLQGVEVCPRCGRANPTLAVLGGIQTITLTEYGMAGQFRFCGLFKCTTCGRTVLAESRPSPSPGFSGQLPVETVLPVSEAIDTEIPPKPRQFLADAMASLNAPTASIMAACSAIDAMLKEKGIRRRDDSGRERVRIDAAVAENVLTADMARWAHKVRLDANDQRHADEDAEMPNRDQAAQIFELAKGLAEILFVLPAKVVGGGDAANPTK